MDASFADVWGVTYEELSERCVRGSRRFNSQLPHDARLRDADHANARSFSRLPFLSSAAFLLAGSMARCWSGFNG
jgi:hypothetical protein